MKFKKISDAYKKISPFSFLSSLGMGIIKIAVAIITKSLGLFISSFYNILIGITKKNVRTRSANSIYRKYTDIGICVIVASILFINYSIAVMKMHLNSTYHMYVSLLIATVTFTDIALAVVGIVKAKKKKDIENEMLKYVNLSTALISLVLTQKSILSFTNDGQDMSFYNGLGGIVIGSIVCTIGIYMAIKGRIQEKSKS